uniref:Uncharacterized protein n=1 Tax=Romanomermis culicivorax TaxID=13658 RepID=A0A915KCW0_ROMCU
MQIRRGSGREVTTGRNLVNPKTSRFCVTKTTLECTKNSHVLVEHVWQKFIAKGPTVACVRKEIKYNENET